MIVSRQSASSPRLYWASGISLRRNRFARTSSTAGVIPRLERLASRFSDKDLVLVESRAASDVHTLALPLSYIYARNVLVLSDSRPDKPAVREFLTWARERTRTYIRRRRRHGSAVAGRRVHRRGDRAIPGARVREDRVRRLSPAVSRKPFDFTIYRLVETGHDSSTANAGHRRHRRSASCGLLSQGKACAAAI